MFINAAPLSMCSAALPLELPLWSSGTQYHLGLLRSCAVYKAPEVHCEYRRVGVDRGAHLVGYSLHDELQNIFFCLEARTVQTMSFTSNVSWL